MKLVAIDNPKHLKQFGVSNDVTVKCVSHEKQTNIIFARFRHGL